MFVACDTCPLASEVRYAAGAAFLDDVADLTLVGQLDPRAVLTPVTRTAQPFTDRWRES